MDDVFTRLQSCAMFFYDPTFSHEPAPPRLTGTTSPARSSLGESRRRGPHETTYNTVQHHIIFWRGVCAPRALSTKPPARGAPPPTVATRIPCGTPSSRRDDRARDHRRYHRGALKFLLSSPFFITCILLRTFTIISLVLKTRAPLRAAPATPCCLCFTRDEERCALTTCDLFCE